MSDEIGEAGPAVTPSLSSGTEAAIGGSPSAGSLPPPRASIDRAFAAIDETEVARGPDQNAAAGEESLAHIDAPARFSSDAKAAWQGAPEAIKAETYRALRELEGGLSQYRQAFEPLKPYFALAHQHDTTVHEAMARYTALDSALLSEDQQEKLFAIQAVLDHAGMTSADYVNLMLGKGQLQPDAHLGELRREITRLKHQMGGVSTSLAQRQYNEIEHQVEAFAQDHPRLEDNNFAETVSRLLSTGMADGLAAAYDMAGRLNPAPTQRPLADQTRKGQLSIAGAPASGSNPVNRKAPATARESLDRSFASLGLG